MILLSAALFFSALWIPGAATLLATRPARFSTSEFVYLSAACSPILLAVPGLLLGRIGLGPVAASWVAYLFYGALFLFAMTRGRTRLPNDIREERSPLLLSAVLMILALILPLLDAHYLYRSDAWFHAAIVKAVETGGVPPAEDPFFAGTPLRYFWLYHYLVLLLSRFSGLDSFWVMTLLSAYALFMAAGGIHLIARRLTRRRRKVGWPELLVFGSMNGYGLFLFVPRLFAGEVRGLEALRHYGGRLEGGIAAALDFLAPFGGKAFFPEKFMVATAFSIALALGMMLLACILSYLQERSRWWLLPLFLITFSLLLLHTTSGAVLGLAAALALVVAHAGRNAGETRRETLLALASPAAALVLAFPYLRTILFGDGEGFPVRLFDPTYMLGVLVTVAVPMALFMMGWKHFLPLSVPHNRAGATWLIVVGLFALAVYGFPHFLFHFFWVLAVCAGASVEMRRRPIPRVWRYVLVATLLPANLVAVRGFLRDSHHAPRDERARREEARGASAEVYRWIAAETPTGSLFLETGTGRFTPALGERSLYWGGSDLARKWGYPADQMKDREELQRRLESGMASLTDIDRLLALGRGDVYLLIVEPTTPSFQEMAAKIDSHPAVYRKVHSDPRHVIYRIDGPRGLD